MLVQTKGDHKPMGRTGHSLCLYENSLVVFGGYDDGDSKALGDLWQIDLGMS